MKKAIFILCTVIVIIGIFLLCAKLITRNSIMDKDGMIYYNNETNKIDNNQE